MPADRLVEQLQKGFMSEEDWVSEDGRPYVRLDHHPTFASYFIPGDAHFEAIQAEHQARQTRRSDRRKRQMVQAATIWGVILAFIAVVPLAVKTGFTVVPEDQMNAVIQGTQDAWRIVSTNVRKAFNQDAAVEIASEERVLPGAEEIARVRAFFAGTRLEGTAGSRLQPAWESLLKGTSAGVVEARQLLEQAVSLDPDHPGALAGLALVYAMQTAADPELSKSSVNLLQRAQMLGEANAGVLRAESGISVVNKAYSQGAERAKSCVKALGGDGICSWYLGMSLLGLEKYQEAVNALLDAEETLAGAPAVGIALAQASLETGDYARSRDRLAELEDSAEDPQVLSMRARLARETGDFDSALDLATRAGDADPLQIESRLLQGELLLYHQAKANAAYQVLSALADDQVQLGDLNPRVLLQASNAARAAGKAEEALGYGDRAVEAQSGWGPAQLTLALSHEMLGDLTSAEEALKGIDSTSVSGREAARVHYRTGMFFRAQDRQRPAEDEFKLAQDEDPSYVQVRLALASTYLRLDSARKGLEYLKELMHVDLEREHGRDPVTLSWYEHPSMVPLNNVLVEKLGNDARLEVQLPRAQGVLLTIECLGTPAGSKACRSAKATLEQALQVDEGDLVAMTFLGRIAVMEGDHQAAKNWLGRVSNSVGNDATVQRLRGEALSGLGMLIGAEQAFKQALGGDAEDPGAHESYAALLFKDGRPKEALEHLGNAAQLDPASVGPRQLLLEYGGD